MFIPQDKLRALSGEALQALREGVNDAIQYNARRSIRTGSIVRWFNAKSNRNVTLCVDNFGPKNVLGHEVDDAGTHLYHKKWRVSPMLVSVVEPTKPVVRAPIGAGADRPMSMVGAF